LDIGGTPVKVIYDMPMGIGEPHYAQMIKADKVNAVNVYPEVGWDAIEWKPSEHATKKGEERIERNGNQVTIYSTSIRSHLTPDRIELKQGDHVIWHITNIETAHDAVHGFQLGGQNVSLSIEPGATVSFEFDADHQRHLRLLLHRVLLGPASGDDGVYVGGAVGGDREMVDW
jgi:nitrous-oxide reductase